MHAHTLIYAYIQVPTCKLENIPMQAVNKL